MRIFYIIISTEAFFEKIPDKNAKKFSTRLTQYIDWIFNYICPRDTYYILPLENSYWAFTKLILNHGFILLGIIGLAYKYAILRKYPEKIPD